MLVPIITPLPWRKWEMSLRQHPDKIFAAYITAGIKHGFRIGFQYNNPKCKHSRHNMPTSRERAEIVHQYLAGECAEGRVVGPLDSRDYRMVHTSPIGVIPKGTLGKWRMIIDLSSPEGSSVNDGIDKGDAHCPTSRLTMQLEGLFTLADIHFLQR